LFQVESWNLPAPRFAGDDTGWIDLISWQRPVNIINEETLRKMTALFFGEGSHLNTDK